MSNEQFQQWLDQSPNIRQWIQQGLQIGLDRLNLESAIISQINNREYKILQAISNVDDAFSAGDKYKLDNTYCEAVARQHKTITYQQVGAMPDMCLHPVYKAAHIESYIGTPIFGTDSGVIGTISFSSRETRAADFSKDEIDFVETMSRKIADVINL